MTKQTKHYYRHKSSAVRAAKARTKKFIIFVELLDGHTVYSVWF